MNSFKSLHYDSNCLIIGNAWDAMSAVIMEQAGFRAIGTTSWGVANSFGYQDGEMIPFEQLTRVIQSILNVVKIPVSVDIESGYSNDSDEIIANVWFFMIPLKSVFLSVIESVKSAIHSHHFFLMMKR